MPNTSNCQYYQNTCPCAKPVWTLTHFIPYTSSLNFSVAVNKKCSIFSLAIIARWPSSQAVIHLRNTLKCLLITVTRLLQVLAMWIKARPIASKCDPWFWAHFICYISILIYFNIDQLMQLHELVLFILSQIIVFTVLEGFLNIS